MAFDKQGSEIWRDYVTPGDSGSGAWEPVKTDIRSWAGAAEAGGGFDTVADFTAKSIDPSAKYARLNAHTAGDFSAGFKVRRVSADPGHAGAWRTVDRYLPNGSEDITNGGWWEIHEKVLRPEHFGAAGDDATDDLAACQDALDVAAAQGGLPVEFSSIYLLSDSLVANSNNTLRGRGLLKREDADNPVPTGTQYALLFIDAVSNVTVQGVAFKAITHQKVDDNSLPRKTGANDPGALNSCIDVNASTDVVIDLCEFDDFSQAVLYRGNNGLTVSNCQIRDGSGHTVAEMKAGTFAPTYTYTGTGGIIHLYDAGGIPDPSDVVQILGNRIEVPGLDVGIDALDQSYDEQPSIVANNFIRGARAGIQAYHGSFPDPGGVSFAVRALIANNHIYGTWEQGIYIRESISVSVIGNRIEFPGQIGTNGGGSSAGGIVTRVNPWNDVATFPSSATTTRHPGVQIIGNTVINPGRDGAGSDGGIHVRVPNCLVADNHVICDETLFSGGAVGSGINCGGGDNASGVMLRGNRVHWFAYGIVLGNANSVEVQDPMRIEGNVITECPIGISASGVFQADGIDFIANEVRGSTTYGIDMRNAPNIRLIDNKILDCAIGIRCAAGCLASDIAGFMTAGSVNASAKRRGATITLRGNRIDRCATPYQVAETNGDDNSFAGRMQDAAENYIDGQLWQVHEASGGVPSAGWPFTCWKGRRIPNSTIAAATLAGKVCTVPGTGGSTTVSTTCSITNGSTEITAPVSWDGIGPKTWLTIDGQDRFVESIDPANDRFFVDQAMTGTTGSGKTLVGKGFTLVDDYTFGAT